MPSRSNESNEKDNKKVHSNPRFGKIELVETALTLREVTVSPGSFSILGSPSSSRLTLSDENDEVLLFGGFNTGNR